MTRTALHPPADSTTDADAFSRNRQFLSAYFAARLGGAREAEAVRAAEDAARLPAHPGLIYTPWDGLDRSEGVSLIEQAIRRDPRYDGQRRVPNDWPRF